MSTKKEDSVSISRASRGSVAASVGSKKSVTSENVCPDCTNQVRNSDKGLMCDVCENWHHIACQQISDAKYKFLSAPENSDVHWFCLPCNKSAAKLLKLITSLQTRQDELEKKMETVEKIVSDSTSGLQVTDTKLKELERVCDEASAKLQTEINEIRNGISEIKKKASETDQMIEGMRKSPPKSWAAIVSEEVNSKFVSVTGDVELVKKAVDESKTKIDEERDKQMRENNIIIYRLPETKSVEEQKREDKATIMELFNEVLAVGVSAEDVKASFRLGKREVSTPENNARSRPLLIQFRDKVAKNRVMENLGKLKHASSRFNPLSISHDMTKLERVECKKLMEEAKAKQSQESGEFLWKVRGPPNNLKLVRIRQSRY